MTMFSAVSGSYVDAYVPCKFSSKFVTEPSASFWKIETVWSLHPRRNTKKN